jgi:competence protein ComEA
MPWRALEDPADRTPPVSEPAAGPASGTRSAVLAGSGAVLLAIAAFLLALSGGTGAGLPVDQARPSVTGAAIEASPGALDGLEDGTGTEPQLVVEVAGAVVKAGVYRLPPGSRVGDLIDRAGGYGPRVDTDRVGRELNLAALLRDGEQVRVPSRDDPPIAVQPPATSAGSPGGGSALVDLNHATAGELDTLPGIGPVTAAKIISAREEQPFGSVDDLRARKLVGEKTFANLKDLVTVR